MIALFRATPFKIDRAASLGCIMSNRGADLLGAGGIDVRDDDNRASTRQLFAQPTSYSRGAPGHDRDLVVKQIVLHSRFGMSIGDGTAAFRT